MLTVRIITANGFEKVLEVTEVEYFPPRKDNEPAQLFLHPCGECIIEGNVYVMNESGKTIASYNLLERE
jgi:hypothetical protein